VSGRFCSKIHIPSHQESSSIIDAQNYTNGTRTGQTVGTHPSRKSPPVLALADMGKKHDVMLKGDRKHMMYHVPKGKI
jgi:hypothetical protein